MFRWLKQRSTTIKAATLHILSIVPLFVVAAAASPAVAALCAVFAVMVGMVSFNAMTEPPRRRLLRALVAWRGGQPFHVDSTSLPDDYASLTRAIELATGRLSEREDELRVATEQQNLLMQEIHHRVKNNLQIVASLLNLQANRIKVPAAQAEFQSARDRVRALATLHRYLYAHGGLETINLREFLTELGGQLFGAFGETPGVRIGLRVDAPEIEMSSDQAVPLALIVTETVSNAVKFAFPDGRRGTIDVRMTADGDQAELVVSDDGVGIEAVSEAGPPGTEGRRDGIGLQLIRGFARQLGGTLVVEDGTGTTYTVSMQLQRKRPVVSAQGVRPAA